MILSILLWFCNTFLLVTWECRFPDEFWSRTDTGWPSIIAMFSSAFFLLFILNAAMYFLGEKENSYVQHFISSTIAVLNAVVIICVSLILLNLVVFNHEYRTLRLDASYKDRDAKGFCDNNKHYFGKWKILENNTDASYLKDYLIFSKDKRLETNNPDWSGYYFHFQEFDDKYKTATLSQNIPEKFINRNTKHGFLDFESFFYNNDYGHWEELRWYFYRIDNELMLIQATSSPNYYDPIRLDYAKSLKLQKVTE